MTGGAGTAGGVRTSGRLRRTRLLTAASVIVVVLAGAAAVGANVGILDSAAETPTGKLSAAGELTGAGGASAAGGSSPAGVPSPVSSVVVPGSGARQFAVDAAGTVTVSGSAGGLRLESVAPASGWRWTATQSTAWMLLITFTDGTRILEFVASSAADGTVSATVTEPGSSATGSSARAASSVAAGSGTATGTASSTSDDSDDDDDDEERSGSIRNGSGSSGSGSSGSRSGRFDGGDDDD